MLDLDQTAKSAQLAFSALKLLHLDTKSLIHSPPWGAIQVGPVSLVLSAPKGRPLYQFQMGTGLELPSSILK